MVTTAAASTTPAVGPEALAAELRSISERLDSMAQVLDTLRPLVTLAQQAPALGAMLGDSFDDVMRRAIERGVDVERGILNGAEAALRFGAIMDASKVRELEVLLQSGVLDPGALRVVGELGRALTDSAGSVPKPARPRDAIKALRDPDVRRALGFLLVVAERFGRRLGEPSERR